MGGHSTPEARRFLGLKWIRPAVADSIVARRGDHFIQTTHDAAGFIVCHPNGISRIYYDVDEAFEHMKWKVP
jgi:hypothetical protein